MSLVTLQAQETNGSSTNSFVDLASRASSENLPQVSAALLRTQIQQEQDVEKRLKLSRRLVALLIAGERFEEALAVSSTVDSSNDPVLAYWKGEALLGTGDYEGAKAIFSSLLQSKSQNAELNADRITLDLARALRGCKETDEAIKLLEEIQPTSLIYNEAILERASDLLSLARSEEALKLLQGFAPGSEEGKAMSSYLQALAYWRMGNLEKARKLFEAVPTTIPWCSAAATIGNALSLSASGKTSQGIDALEKHLDLIDDDPLFIDQFILLDQLYASAGVSDTSLLKKWADDASHPNRARLAAFFQAKGELRLKHAEGGETLLDAFIRKYPDDSLADQARVLLSSSRLQRGLTSDAYGWASDRPAALPVIRAKLDYLRGLTLASLGKPEEAKNAFQLAASLDPSLSQNALFNKTVLIATTDKGSLDTSVAAKEMIDLNAGMPSEEMKFQLALDLIRRGEPTGVSMLNTLADQTSENSLKSRARLAAAEWNMKSGQGDAAVLDLAKAINQNSAEPERTEYLNVFLKDTGKKSDAPEVITAARAFLKAHPDSRFVPEVRLKLAESLLASGDVQAARVEFEQIAFSNSGTEIGRRALFLAAQSAAREMDPASLDDSLMLLERVTEHDSADQLVWQARLQQGALKNAQNLSLEALAIYDKVLSSSDPDPSIRTAALMAKADTLHQLALKDPAQDREAIKYWTQLAEDPSVPLAWRNQALCKSGLVLEKLGDGDAALAAYYQAFKNPRTTEPEQLWHDKAAFDAGRLLESRKQWKDAVALYAQIIAEGGPRAEEAKARVAKLRLENFLWEN